MHRYHPLLELAPRDVVSRSIVMELRATGDASAFLDMTHFPPGFIHAHFPRIYETCLSYGVNLETTPAPVRPAAHYAMGGVKTDLNGLTTLPRLYAAGEVACTGVHGANRLASNSLLEGVVFGTRAGNAMSRMAERHSLSAIPKTPVFPAMSEKDLRALAWNSCGVLRNGPELAAAHQSLMANFQGAQTSPGRASFELRNMHQVALLISQAALAREESRGGHYRTDFPAKSPAFQKHSIITKGPDRREDPVAFA
jgi:L-aspartate oxidase